MKSVTSRFSYLMTALLAVTSLSVQAVESNPVEQYKYGMKLDVQKVLALHEEPSQWCQVVDARMDYLDSNGQKRSLAYVKLSDSCSDGD
ncbi:DUF2790 domain-containing protein [Pseudomonas sp. R-28-1W-6]|uniref:DUF2790 domain-containing protein n=1 Tax=Pseudomonas sp. R-28-1W-6 TaxID=2650101 RepID=UPI001365FCA0|nr:DUF2790 domain-containing protein [Pseudomonas sp. R-28-1W-6]MWV14326.1 DUF2790 domain-containing protein [Pseudomonas sp. R-28-1W-6]